jgi:hypothetical protein
MLDGEIITTLKELRFKRVAARRTEKILNMIRLLGNCSNSNVYTYSNTDVKKIFTVIEDELMTAKSKFAEQKKIKFSLGGDE